MCSGFLFLNCDKTLWTSNNLMGEGVYFFLVLNDILSLKEARAETQGITRVKDRSRRYGGWPLARLAARHKISLLSYSAQAHLTRNGSTHTGLGPPPSISNPDNALRTCLQTNLMKAILQLRLLLPRCTRPTAKISYHRVVNPLQPMTLCTWKTR